MRQLDGRGIRVICGNDPPSPPARNSAAIPSLSFPHNKMKTLFLHILIAILALVAPMHADEPLEVSMIQLIATPDKFHGKFVRVIGYLHLEFEGNALYLHREDHLAAISMNGIWFGGTVETMKTPKVFTDQYMLVEGTFDSKSHGHMGMWSGAISNVKRVYPWGPFVRGPKPKK